MRRSAFRDERSLEDGMLAYQRGQTPLCFEARLEDRKERMASSERGRGGIDYHENPCTRTRLGMHCVC